MSTTTAPRSTAALRHDALCQVLQHLTDAGQQLAKLGLAQAPATAAVRNAYAQCVALERDAHKALVAEAKAQAPSPATQQPAPVAAPIPTPAPVAAKVAAPAPAPVAPTSHRTGFQTWCDQQGLDYRTPGLARAWLGMVGQGTSAPAPKAAPAPVATPAPAASCKGLTAKGQPCKAPATLVKNGYCGKHQDQAAPAPVAPQQTAIAPTAKAPATVTLTVEASKAVLLAKLATADLATLEQLAALVS
jgi:hypothetical protein